MLLFSPSDVLDDIEMQPIDYLKVLCIILVLFFLLIALMNEVNNGIAPRVLPNWPNNDRNRDILLEKLILQRITSWLGHSRHIYSREHPLGLQLTRQDHFELARRYLASGDTRYQVIYGAEGIPYITRPVRQIEPKQQRLTRPYETVTYSSTLQFRYPISDLHLTGLLLINK